MDKLQLMCEFPKLADTYFDITSPSTKSYNCIAWAAGENHRWWWPDSMRVHYWPKDAPREATIGAFIAAYATIGFQLCENGDAEAGYEKIALYLKPGGTPTHAARQLPNGKWTSKLGNAEDIQHELAGIECRNYGSAKQFLKRPIPVVSH